ncbi:MAG: hypothetical protein H7301_02520 [Cryobacterium sp.]|nr:hypothetical protein [Oligoflexia bacterium]
MIDTSPAGRLRARVSGTAAGGGEKTGAFGGNGVGGNGGGEGGFSDGCDLEAGDFRKEAIAFFVSDFGGSSDRISSRNASSDSAISPSVGISSFRMEVLELPVIPEDDRPSWSDGFRIRLEFPYPNLKRRLEEKF